VVVALTLILYERGAVIDDFEAEFVVAGFVDLDLA